MRLLLSAFMVLSCVVACGDGEIEGNDDDVTTFDCEGVTCDSAAGELCWFQRFSNGDVHSATCLKPETPCTSCSCAEDAVAVELDGGNNCSALTACRQEGDAITYSCDNPGF